MENKIKQRIILLGIFGPLILMAMYLNNPTLSIGSVSFGSLFITIIVIGYSVIFLTFMFSDKTIPPKKQDMNKTQKTKKVDENDYVVQRYLKLCKERK